MLRFFRKNTIFHAERANPDAEELKIRFRRRVLGLTFLGFLLILGVPVVRSIQLDLSARNNARLLAQVFVDSRSLAALSRSPVSLALSTDGKTWERRFHLPGEDCSQLAEGPSQLFLFDNAWKVQMKTSSGESKQGQLICLHPQKGVLLEGEPLQSGALLIATKWDGEEFNPSYLLFSEFGSEVQLVSNRRP